MAGPLPYLRLLRVGTLFSPAADVVAGLCVTDAPWSVDAARAIGASVCLYTAGMVLNDFADRREDARQRPERPIPSGSVRPATALSLGCILVAASLALAPVLWYWALMAVLVLSYDFATKRVAVLGALNMGALRGLNLGAGALLAGTLAEPTRIDVWIAAGAYGVYIVAVTLLGIMEDVRWVKPRTVLSLQAVPPLVALMALWAVGEGPWPAATIALVLAIVFAARNRRVVQWERTAIRGSMTWLLLGTMLYTGLLCLAAGRPLECLAILAAVPPARWISRRIALT